MFPFAFSSARIAASSEYMMNASPPATVTRPVTSTNRHQRLPTRCLIRLGMDCRFFYIQFSEHRPLKQSTCHPFSITGGQPTGRQVGVFENSCREWKLGTRRIGGAKKHRTTVAIQTHGGLWTLNCNRLRSDCRELKIVQASVNESRRPTFRVAANDLKQKLKCDDPGCGVLRSASKAKLSLADAR
jgi:hypothetical protein